MRDDEETQAAANKARTALSQGQSPNVLSFEHVILHNFVPYVPPATDTCTR